MQKYLVIRTEHIYSPKDYNFGEVTKFITDKPIYSHVKDDDEFKEDIDYIIGDRATLEGEPDMTEHEFREVYPSGIDNYGADYESYVDAYKCDCGLILTEPPECYDGYGSNSFTYEVKPITEEQALDYQLIIDKYKSL